MAKILITEDEALIALDLQLILSEQGHQVIGIAADAEEFNQLFKLHEPDLIFMDINLQGKIDGMAIAQKIRQSFDTPIVFCSAFSESSYMDDAEKLGRSNYLSKPFSEESVAVAIENILYTFGTHFFFNRMPTLKKEIWVPFCFQVVEDNFIRGKNLF